MGKPCPFYRVEEQMKLKCSGAMCSLNLISPFVGSFYAFQIFQFSGRPYNIVKSFYKVVLHEDSIHMCSV